MAKVVRTRHPAAQKANVGLADSQLRAPKVERFHLNDETGSYDMLKVECPNSICRRSFWVEPGPWLAGHEQGGRTYFTSSCPYCYKTMRRTGPPTKEG